MFRTFNEVYYYYKTIAYATDDRLREIEIMKSLIDIETVYTRKWPCLTILDNVWFELKQYWSYVDRMKPCVHGWAHS